MLMLAVLFLFGVLYSTGGGFLFPVLAVILLLYSAPWKEQGLRRLCFSAGLVLAFVLGLLHTGQEISFRNRYLSLVSEGQQVRLSGKLTGVEKKLRCNYYYLTDCYIRLFDQTMPCNDVLAYMSDFDGSIGQILELQGTITLFDEAANEGGFDSRAFYRSQKIDLGLLVGKVCSVSGKPDRFRCFLEELRERMKTVIDTGVEDQGVLAAMLLGDRSALEKDTKSLYQSAGISHILAISGFHMSLLGLGLYHLLKRRLGLSYPVSVFVTAVFLMAYTIMTGGGISTRRAVMMLFVFLLADLLGLGYDLLSGLGLAVLVLLWENPFLTGYSGFQFSVAAVLGIAVGGKILTEFLRYCMGWGTGHEKQKESLCMSLAIQLFTLPLVAYNYYELPVYAMLLNAFVLAGVGCLLLLAAAGAVLGMLFPVLGKILLAPCSLMLHIYRWLCQASLALPGARYICGKPAVWRIVLYYLLLGLLLYLLWCPVRKKLQEGERVEKKLRCRDRIRKGVKLAIPFTLLVLLLLFPEKKEFEITVLDVGQGEGIYLCTSEGVSMFIDGGSTSEKQVGEYRILPFLKARGVQEIDYWFVSHTDSDHISGLSEVLKSGYRIHHLACAKAVEGEAKTKELAALAENAGVKVQYLNAGERLAAGSAAVECLYPSATQEAEDVNDLCLTLLYTEGKTRALFAGDLSSEVEDTLVRSGKLGKVDFYKADHHGSKYSSSEDFLQEIRPAITVASAGAGNRYGHPGTEAVERIKKTGSRFYCTMDYGEIRVKRKKGKMQCLTKNAELLY